MLSPEYDTVITCVPTLSVDVLKCPRPCLSVTVANVKTTAHRVRQHYRGLLREEIAQTVAQPGEIDEEIRYLMRIVSR